MAGHEGELAVVTGASSGIGLELARVLAEEGFDLVINAEDDDLDQATAELRAQGANVDPVKVDLAEPSGVEQLFERITAQGRPIDVLCLNAGVGAGGDFVGETELEKELKLSISTFAPPSIWRSWR